MSLPRANPWGRMTWHPQGTISNCSSLTRTGGFVTATFGFCHCGRSLLILKIHFILRWQRSYCGQCRETEIDCWWYFIIDCRTRIFTIKLVATGPSPLGRTQRIGNMTKFSPSRVYPPESWDLASCFASNRKCKSAPTLTHYLLNYLYKSSFLRSVV